MTPERPLPDDELSRLIRALPDSWHSLELEQHPEQIDSLVADIVTGDRQRDVEQPIEHDIDFGIPSRSPTRSLAAVAAAVLVVAGLGGALYVRSGRDSTTNEPAASPVGSVSTPAPTTTSLPATGPLLTSTLASDDRPLITVGQPGWTVQAYSGFDEVPVNATTAACEGCAIQRLVVAADGPLFGGPIFTAWIYGGPFQYPPDSYRTPLTVGSIEGRSDSGPIPAPSSTNDVFTRIAWPISGGRYAFVESYGIPDVQVLAMAKALTFESALPTLATPPAGFSIVLASPLPQPTEHAKITFVNGAQTLDMTVANSGLQGLLDSRGQGGVNPLVSGWAPRIVDGVAVAFLDPSNGTGSTGLVATWVAGDWSYAVNGYGFASNDDFLAAIAALQLTDAATFTASTANVELTPIQNWFD